MEGRSLKERNLSCIGVHFKQAVTSCSGVVGHRLLLIKRSHIIAFYTECVNSSLISNKNYDAYYFFLINVVEIYLGVKKL